MEVLKITLVEEKSIQELLCTIFQLREKLKKLKQTQTLLFQVCINHLFNEKSYFLFMRKGIFYLLLHYRWSRFPSVTFFLLFLCISVAVLHFGAAKCAQSQFYCARAHVRSIRYMVRSSSPHKLVGFQRSIIWMCAPMHVCLIRSGLRSSVLPWQKTGIALLCSKLMILLVIFLRNLKVLK